VVGAGRAASSGFLAFAPGIAPLGNGSPVASLSDRPENPISNNVYYLYIYFSHIRP
jgi:hypothetical protein